MDDHYYNESRALYQVLDWVGASEDMRHVYKEVSMVLEILATIELQQHTGNVYGVYRCGSSCEGTTTPGLNSDVDVLHCLDDPVVESISDAPRHELSLVMVRDESTKPGYVKLQVVFDGVGQTIYHRETIRVVDTDHQGRICVKHLTEIVRDDPLFQVRNGPAWSQISHSDSWDMDNVPAYRYPHIPTFAQSWIYKDRPHSWPHPRQIDKMKRNGCFLVGVNHPSSQNGPIEWRVSFSLQERELMLNLNPTQHKCYVLFKMIKKDIIHKSVQKSISSYHCKTCLFYAIENNPAEFWACRNLLDCTRVCIKLLLDWVREQNCPNYFIPEENMFDRLQPETLSKVKTVLEDLLEHWPSFLWSLSCDDIGNVLYDVLYGSGPGVLAVKNGASTGKCMSLYVEMQSAVHFNFRYRIHEIKSGSSSELLKQLYGYKLNLTRTDHVTEHTEEDIRLAISYIMPHLHLEMPKCLASILLNIRDKDLAETMFDKFMNFISESRECDLLSSNLMVASFCLQSSWFEASEKYLLGCEIGLRTHTVLVCCCDFLNIRFDGNSLKRLAQHFNRKTPTFKDIRTHVTSCISFHPSQSDLVHPALRLEMYRSVNTPPGSRIETRNFWVDWIVVDSEVYVYFLQYVLYTRTNNPVCKQKALDNLVHLIMRDGFLGHRETAHNLLGWIYKQERKHELAMNCFLTSWRLRPDHNAAKWHGIELIRSVNMPV